MFRPFKPVALASMLLAGSAFAATVGQPAPSFAVADAAGKTVSLADIAAGKAVAQPVTRPYGCSVKYADG